MHKTSISDYKAYKDVCVNATNDDKVFNVFRQNSDYMVILEHVTAKHGAIYLDTITQQLPSLLEHFDRFKTSDTIGDPKLAHYPTVGQISPTTLRYIKVLSDLIQIFGSLNAMHICEIGVGYGGQCKIINDIAKISTYTLVDLDETIGLAKKYMSHFDLCELQFVNPSMNEVINSQFDLVISNYAFSELTIKMQELYLERIVKNSRRGYMTLNYTSHLFDIESMSYNALIGRLVDYGKNVIELQEVPLTSPHNKIVAWNA